MRYLGRLPNASIDVIARADLAAETLAIEGVARVITFEDRALSVGALGRDALASIGAMRYDLCVIPRREPTGWGFENLVPLARASGSRTAIWLDIFGRTGLLAGRPHGWIRRAPGDRTSARSTTCGAPFARSISTIPRHQRPPTCRRRSAADGFAYMGTSNWQNISYCVGILRRLQPASVLDVGTGFGRWGTLCREFLDVWEGREARSLWQARIEGIEAFPQCLTPASRLHLRQGSRWRCRRHPAHARHLRRHLSR